MTVSHFFYQLIIQPLELLLETIYGLAMILFGKPALAIFLMSLVILNGEIYIWEHFGLLDDPEYLAKMLRKLRVYINNGWIPGHRLIITTETKDQVLDINTIPDIIRQYFQI